MHALGPSWLDPQQLIDTYALPGALIVVFIECGLFIFFLPGDSLLFTVGLLLARGSLHHPLVLVLLVLAIAAFAGNVAGYEIGRAAGGRIVSPTSRLVKTKHIEKTHEFFAKYGARALVLGRFVPIVRTYITLVAGVGRMQRRVFYTYSAIGAVLWVVVVTMAGYWLGNVTFVRNNLELILLLIVLISVVPIGIEFLRHKRSERRESQPDA